MFLQGDDEVHDGLEYKPEFAFLELPPGVGQIQQSIVIVLCVYFGLQVFDAECLLYLSGAVHSVWWRCITGTMLGRG